MDVKTLFITACASAAAAYACSKIWAPGTLASAAFTPVLVALLKEGLAKPTAAVARAVPVRGVVRSAGVHDPVESGDSWSATSVGEQLGGDYAPAAPAETAPLDNPAARVAQSGEIQYHSSRGRMRGWRVAVITGLLGFLISAVVFTVPELVAGGSAAGGGRDTTIFGGKKQSQPSTPAVTTQTTTTPEQTETQTVTVPPAETVTVPPPEVTTTTPVPPPAETTTTPTTTVPAPGEPPPPEPPG